MNSSTQHNDSLKGDLLVKDKKEMDQRGRNITTTMDVFRVGRKFNAKQIYVEQNLADFASGIEPSKYYSRIYFYSGGENPLRR